MHTYTHLVTHTYTLTCMHTYTYRYIEIHEKRL